MVDQNRSENQHAAVVEGEALTVRDQQHSAGLVRRDLALHRDPEQVLAEAGKAAAALMRVLNSKKDPVMMGGERYIEADDWQVIGRFYGVTAKVVSTEFKVYEIPGRDEIYGFDAVAVALLAGRVELSRAEASCLSDEEKWGARTKYGVRYAKAARKEKGQDGKLHTVMRNGKPAEITEWHPIGHEPDTSEMVWVPNPNKPGKSMPYRERVKAGVESVPLFQMKSMAQTRACAKVMRQLFSDTPTMAGFKPTPAEEMPTYDRPPIGVDPATGEILEASLESDEGKATAQRATARQEQRKEPPKKETAAEKKQREAADKKEAAKKKPKPDKRTPEQQEQDETGFGGELPSENVYVVSSVTEHRTNKGPVWQVALVDASEREHTALTTDPDIVEVASEAAQSSARTQVILEKGKLKYPEISEITILD